MSNIRPAEEDIATRTVRKVSRRLLPVIVLCAFFAFLDRVNIGFAAVQMQADLSMSATAYGIGAGIFFIAYFLFEIPSNIVMLRVGPGGWLMRIMFSWGLISALTAFTAEIAGSIGISQERVFFGLRFLLGAAEAGFSPCIVYYISLWFPNRRRAHALAIYSAIVPFSALIGAPLSGALLDLHMLGLSGWQWMFLIEAVPAMLLAPIAWRRLTGRPAEAHWLTQEERDWLDRTMAAEQHATGSGDRPIGRVIRDPRVLALGLVLFCILCAFYAILFFLPQVIAGLGSSNFQLGLIGALPYLASSVAMILWGRHSDRSGERRLHFALSALLVAMGLAGVAFIIHPLGKLPFLTLAAVGAFCCMPVFWPIAQAFLSGRAAATGLAAINCIGNLGGFVAPILMGAVHDRTGRFDDALYIMSALALVAALIVAWPRIRSRNADRFDIRTIA
jgi:ACS family tartrate transporter-like MFS transporter